jgi:hypothetical protein
MPRSFLTSALQRLHPKDDDRNLVSATFHMITITLISMSLVDLTWFTISGDLAIPNLTLGQFFWFGYSGADVDYSGNNQTSHNIKSGRLFQTIILLTRPL